MRAAHALASRCLRKYASKFSRHDYTLPQLFACLAVREQMRLSYRGAEALLRDGRAWCRAIGIRRKTPDHATLHRAAGVLLTGRRLGRALADAGFDSEANHEIARRDLGVRSLIKAGVGRPGASPPAGRWRRRMARELAGSQKGRPYGQRAQAETVMSMLKRNQGDALRARSPRARKAEHLFKAVVHNLMLARRRSQRRVETEPQPPICGRPGAWPSSAGPQIP